MNLRTLITMLLAALISFSPMAFAGETDKTVAPAATEDQAVDIQLEKKTPALVSTPISKAHLRMQADSYQMIDAMQKSIVLVQKRIELAKRKYSFVCVECMEKELPWMSKQLESASMWGEILEEPASTPLDRLEAYWAIQDTYKNVKNMREKTDKYWQWKLEVD